MATPNVAAENIVHNLANQGTLLMKMRILSLGKNYDIMDQNQNVLCQIGLDAGQNIKGSLVGGAVSAVAGDWAGRLVKRSLQYTYTVKDPAGGLALEIRKGSGAYKARFDVVDPLGGPSPGYIQMKRSFIGGLKAFWYGPTGQPVMHTKGNIIRRKYRILNASNQQVGFVRHKILAIRDVWQLELTPGVNHLYAAIFATVLDFEKKM